MHGKKCNPEAVARNTVRRAYEYDLVQCSSPQCGQIGFCKKCTLRFGSPQFASAHLQRCIMMFIVLMVKIADHCCLEQHVYQYLRQFLCNTFPIKSLEYLVDGTGSNSILYEDDEHNNCRYMKCSSMMILIPLSDIDGGEDIVSNQSIKIAGSPNVGKTVECEERAASASWH